VDDLTKSMETEESRKLINYVARQIANETPETNIVRDLEKKGFHKEQAREFVRQVEILRLSTETRTEKKKPSKIASIFMILFGVALEVLAIWSIVSAIDNGGILWWGGIIVGFGLIGAGLRGLRS